MWGRGGHFCHLPKRVFDRLPSFILNLQNKLEGRREIRQAREKDREYCK